MKNKKGVDVSMHLLAPLPSLGDPLALAKNMEN